MDLFDLSGQTAVITGAAQGLGLSFASALARAHCNIAAVDKATVWPENLLQLRSKYGVRVEVYTCDVSSKPQVDETIEQIQRAFGRIDINVNAAGIVTNETFLSTREATLNRAFSINVNGSVFVAQACAASMIKRITSTSNTKAVDPAADGGSIIFITSISTHIPSVAQNISAYVASKAAVRGLVKPMAVELARYGIRVNSLSPGYMMTEMMKGLQEEQPDLVRQFEKETLLCGSTRIGRPEELQGPLLLLASRTGGGWMTGQDLLVDGGAASWKHAGAIDFEG